MGASDVHDVFEALAGAAPEIRAGFGGRREKTERENASGERQVRADLHADDVLRERLGGLEAVREYASEERDDVLDVGDGPLSVSVDPLDGSSNLTSNNPTGTIVGVYDDRLPASGDALVGAAYVLYGPLTTMVAAADGEVLQYDLTGSDGADGGGSGLPAGDPVTLPDEPTVYGFGGRRPEWREPFVAYADAVEDELKLRYGGAMVGDVNQVLTYGGVFAYPALRERSAGKLRTQFEAAPMAYVVEAAGGASTDGTRSLLSVEPEGVHERTPVFLGNEDLIRRAERALDGD